MFVAINSQNHSLLLLYHVWYAASKNLLSFLVSSMTQLSLSSMLFNFYKSVYTGVSIIIYSFSHCVQIAFKIDHNFPVFLGLALPSVT